MAARAAEVAPRPAAGPRTAGAKAAGDATYASALLNLVLKDFRTRYRNMSLGILWSLLNPLIMMGVLAFVFSVIFPNRAQGNFPIFLLIGLLAFNFFSLNLSSMTGCILENKSIVKKVYFPRLLLPISILISNLVHALIQLSLLAAFMLLFRISLGPAALWYPLTWLVLMAFTLGTGLWCAALCVLYRDTQYLVQSLLTVLFWFTPIFYSLDAVQQNVPAWLFRLYLLNPMAGVIDAGRSALLHGRAPDLGTFAVTCLAALLALVSGLLFFRRMQFHLSDRI